jgi:hypothetical protein
MRLGRPAVVPAHWGTKATNRTLWRRLAFDTSLPPAEALGRTRDAYHDYDQSQSWKPMSSSQTGS